MSNSYLARGKQATVAQLTVPASHGAAVQKAIEGSRRGNGTFPTNQPTASFPDSPNIPPRANPGPSSGRRRSR